MYVQAPFMQLHVPVLIMHRPRRTPAPPPSSSSSSSSSTPPRPRAVVVGAGLSGLSCACELRARGWSVVVLEARPRTGGRVHSARLLNGAPVDVGASFVHGVEENPVADVARRRGARLVERERCPLFAGGGEARRRVDKGVDVRVEARFNDALAGAARRRGRANVPKEESLEEAFRHALQAQAGPPLSALEKRVLGWHLSNLEYAVNADLKDVRNDGWDADDAFGLEGAHTVVGGGMGCVVDALEETLGSELILLNRIVTKVDYSDGYGVTVTARVSTSKHYETHRGDVVVITVPLGVLKAKTITFHPALPELKTKAIARLGFGVLNKITLLFPEAFWRRQNGEGSDEMFGWCAAKRGEFPIFVDGSHDGFAVLIVLVSGTPAADLERTCTTQPGGEAKCIAALLKVLRDMFGSNVVPQPLEVNVTAWKGDEFARGSYSYVAVGSTPDDYDVLAACVTRAEDDPTPRVFFAGEATSRLFPASVHGAFFSGVREALHLTSLWTGSARIFPHRDFSCTHRLYLPKVPFRDDDVTPAMFRTRFAPKHSFEVREVLPRGELVLSGAPAFSEGTSITLTVPPPPATRAGEPRREKRPRTAAATAQSPRTPAQASAGARTASGASVQLKPGTWIEVEWEDQTFAPAVVTPVWDENTHSLCLENVVGLYYPDSGEFERVDLREVGWRYVE